MRAERIGTCPAGTTPPNPLLDTWATPFGLPPFDRITPDHFRPAFEQALAEHRAEIAAIADISAAPTFANTIDALERAEPLVALMAVATLLVVRGDAIAARVMAWASSEANGQVVQALMPSALMPVFMVGALLGGLVLLVGLGAVMAND